MEPLGAYQPVVSAPLALALGALAVILATALLEMSRTLAETYRGRWFAGNGRDIFHGAATAVIALALLADGLPPALACLAGAIALTLPLLLLDGLPARRQRRVAMLLVLVGLAVAPPLLEPRTIVETANFVALHLFFG